MIILFLLALFWLVATAVVEASVGKVFFLFYSFLPGYDDDDDEDD